MTVSSFIKENRVLVAGLVLPLLLIGILAFAKNIPASTVPLPEHKVVYFSKGWGNNGQINIKVDDNGKLNAVFNTANYGQSISPETAPKTIIFIYDAKTNMVEDVTVTLDKNNKVTSLDKFKDITVSTQLTATDGYIFEAYRSHNYSLLTDIFSYRSYNNGPALTNKGRIIDIPQPRTYFGQLEFVGWVK